MTSVYINTDPATRIVGKIPVKVCTVLLEIYNQITPGNICNKKKIQKGLHWVKDKRSWKKYWKELVDKELIIYLDQDTFMVSPHQCYREGVSHKVLIDQWTKLRGSNATH